MEGVVERLAPNMVSENDFQRFFFFSQKRVFIIENLINNPHLCALDTLLNVENYEGFELNFSFQGKILFRRLKTSCQPSCSDGWIQGGAGRAAQAVSLGPARPAPFGPCRATGQNRWPDPMDTSSCMCNIKLISLPQSS